MIRPKLLLRLVVSLIFLSTAIVVNALGETNSPHSNFSESDQSPGGDYFDAESDYITLAQVEIEPEAITGETSEDGAISDCADCPPDSKPYFVNFTAIDSFFLCEGQSVYDTFVVTDSNLNQKVTVELISGPGTLVSTTDHPPVKAYYEYKPLTGESFEITLLAYDSNGDSTIVTKTYHVFANLIPFITSTDTTFFNCFGGKYYHYDINAFDPDSSTYLRFRVLSHPGTIDFYTGELQFWADQPGQYCFLVEVADNCGADTAEICVDIVFNSTPILNNPDQVFHICAPDSICFDIFATDPDGENVIITQLSGPGAFNTTSDTSGQTCFMPDYVDSADYVFIYQAVDSCLSVKCSEGELSCPPIPLDTVVITVIRGETAFLACPNDTSLFICQPDTLCFPLGELPEGAIVTVDPPSAWYDALNGTVCFYTNCTVKKDIKVVVESICGMDSCMFGVNVTMNSAPLVIAAPDTAMSLCDLDEICFAVGISDVDDNITQITVTPSGIYNSITGEVCFTPVGAGTSTIIITAIDDCGAVDADSISIDITLNSKPTITATTDTAVYFCNIEEICIPVEISDADDDIVGVSVSPSGYYDSEKGVVCFTPDSSGTFAITVKAADICGSEGMTTINVTVGLDNPPVVISADDSTVFLCELEQICFPVNITDHENNITAINVYGDGRYVNGFVCFTPTQSGDYTFIIQAEDECGNRGSDTTIINVTVNSAPTVEMESSLEVFQCVFEQICIDVNVFDIDDNLTGISTDFGSYDAENRVVCFTPSAAGTYMITVTATDECYASGKDVIFVTVVSGEGASIVCPDGPISKSLCGAQTICYALEVTPDEAVLSTSYGSITDSSLCFTADTAGTYIIRIIADASCGSDTCDYVFNVDMGEIPEISCPADTAVSLCGADAICLPIEISPAGANITVSPAGYYENGSICFDVDSSGHYEITIVADNDCGADTCSFAVDVSFNGAPDITTGDTVMFICEPSIIDYPVIANDFENDPITYSLVSGPGSINPETGLISLNAESSGKYCFTVAASDFCGSDTAEICITVAINSAPVVVSPEDFQIKLCQPSPQCFPVDITDIDDNIAGMTVSKGSYSHEYVCFTPDTSGIYQFVITATDSCGASDADTTIVEVILNTTPVVTSAPDFDTMLCDFGEICVDVDIFDAEDNIQSISSNTGYYNFETKQVCFSPEAEGTYYIITTVSDSCFSSDVDTTVVTVTLDQSPAITCPVDPANVRICQAQDFCFPIELSPSSALVTTSYGTYSDGQLCFMADSSGMYVIMITAETSCGTDTCYAAFDVVIGETPQLTCPADTTIELCVPEKICLPIGMSPANAVIGVSPGGYYENGSICFNAEASGHYEFLVTLENDCGTDSCSFAVDVVLQGAPAIVAEDTAMFICEPGTVEYQIGLTGNENDQAAFTLIAGSGEVNSQSGLLNFAADTSGLYCFTVKAANDCGADTADFCIDITLNNRPVVISVEDFQINLCKPSPQCFAVAVSDFDGNIAGISVNTGAYSHGYVCFTPYTSGQYTFVITAVDSCGATAMDTTVINVVMNTTPIVISAPDIDTFLCSLDEICVDVEIDDAEGNIESIASNIGQFNFETNQICFTPDGEGTYYLVTTAVDSCGKSDADTTIVNVTMGEGASITCPVDPADVFLCQPQEFCFPLEITAQTVSTSYGSYSAGQLCFYADSSGTYVIEVIATTECGSDTCYVAFNISLGETVSLTCPPDTSMTICGPETVCLPVMVSPVNAAVTVSPFGTYQDGHVCLDIEQAGNYEFTLTAQTDCSLDSCSFAVNAQFNRAPELIASDTSIYNCSLAETYQYQVRASDFENDIINFDLISPAGNINPATGLITFTADSAGTYCFDVVASDVCGADTATICITLDLNSTPVVIAGNDTTVISCDYSEICIPVDAYDSDGNLEAVTSNSGSYADGLVCFSVDGAGVYAIIVTTVDICGATDVDTAIVTVIGGQSLSLQCPPDTSIFICNPDTLCIPMGGIPEGALVTVNPQSAWYDASQQTVCFFTNCSVEKDLKIIARTDCAVDSCTFSVNVTMNSAPLAIMQPDTVLALCAPKTICLAVGISDVDDNIIAVEVSPGAAYNEITGSVCFTPNTGGKHVIKVRAVDACGLYDLDSTVVTVNFNSIPQVIVPSEYDAFVCEIDEVCFPVEIIDANNNITDISVSPSGQYNPATGEVCFAPEADGTYRIVTIATDACGYVVSDTTSVNVIMNRPPSITAADTTVFSCSRITVCVPISAQDPDGNLSKITVTGAGYSSGYACFSTSVSGIRQLIIKAVDSCGAIDMDTIYVNTIINSAPLVISGPDTLVFQCVFSDICIDVDISDIDYNIATIETNYGSYDASSYTVCFTPTEAGTYEIITTVHDACGLVSEDRTIVTVETVDPPQIDCPGEPVAKFLCGPGLICYELGVSPANAIVTTSYGSFENGNLCFQADTAGTYIINLTAETACGSDECTLTFDVVIGEGAVVSCPADTAIFLCGAAQICLPVTVSPDYAQITVLPIGAYSEGMVCFSADTAGTYRLLVVAATDCGSDSCTIQVDVEFNAAPVVDASNDTTYFQCDLQEICHKVNIVDSDNSIDSIKVMPFGTYSELTGSVCFMPPDTGLYCFTVTAYDECGATDSDEFCVTITTGPAADIQCPTAPIYKRICDPGEICVPLTITPASANITVSFGHYANGTLCFYADTTGLYNIRVIASDICGADTCNVAINVAFDAYVSIGCPSLPVSVSLCQPDTVSILVPITPSSASLTIQPAGIYNFQTKMLKFFADTSGHYVIKVIAGTPCSIDTCVIEADVSLYQVPQITCPGNIDTLICLSETSEICFPASVVGAEVTIKILPAGSYSGGMVCVPVTSAGLHRVTIIASSQCGADTCITNINVRANVAPVLTVPEDIVVPWCDDETEPLCIDGIFAKDNNGDALTITKVCGMGTYTPIRADSGIICFDPPNIDSTYEFCVEVTDGCSTDLQSFLVTVFTSPLCSVCVDISIEVDSCHVVGSNVPVRIMAETRNPIGGFDLLIGYDASVLSFTYAVQGDDIDQWEYFTYRLITDATCGSSCPSGLVRLVGIADENNGPSHPPTEQLSPNGILSVIGLRIANNQNLGGQYLPINFYWIDCGDNSLANPIGDQLYIDSRIYNSSGGMLWDEFADNQYPETSRPLGLGAPDECLEGDKTAPTRCVYFHNGGICVTHPDSIDARGDVNLNGVAYEIADAVVFTNYFIYGVSAFTTNVAGQTAATDVNADGFTLTVADLVYLVRVIIGDASAIPKVSPSMLEVDLTVTERDSKLSIAAESECPVGAALLVFEYDGVIPEMPVLGNMANDMRMAYKISYNEIRVLIYSFDKGQAIEAGEGEIISINYSGKGHISLVETAMASYHGDIIRTSKIEDLLPSTFSVSQNYPNPFNPATSIDLSLPVACHWELNIYNINGQFVRGFDGEAQPGIVTVTWDGRNDGGQMAASGVYFYKVQAGEFTAKKKMTLLK